jgi:hypothetical protein
MKANLEATLPTTVIIGPFFITIEQLRHFLIGKRQDLATKLLDMFCQRMKQCIEEVLVEYNNISEKLGEKPDCIESVFEIRDWMETIPMLVRTQEDLVRRYLIVSRFFFVFVLLQGSVLRSTTFWNISGMRCLRKISKISGKLSVGPTEYLNKWKLRNNI